MALSKDKPAAALFSPVISGLAFLADCGPHAIARAPQACCYSRPGDCRAGNGGLRREPSVRYVPALGTARAEALEKLPAFGGGPRGMLESFVRVVNAPAHSSDVYE